MVCQNCHSTDIVTIQGQNYCINCGQLVVETPKTAITKSKPAAHPSAPPTPKVQPAAAASPPAQPKPNMKVSQPRPKKDSVPMIQAVTVRTRTPATASTPVRPKSLDTVTAPATPPPRPPASSLAAPPPATTPKKPTPTQSSTRPAPGAVASDLAWWRWLRRLPSWGWQFYATAALTTILAGAWLTWGIWSHLATGHTELLGLTIPRANDWPITQQPLWIAIGIALGVLAIGIRLWAGGATIFGLAKIADARPVNSPAWHAAGWQAFGSTLGLAWLVGGVIVILGLLGVAANLAVWRLELSAVSLAAVLVLVNLSLASLFIAVVCHWWLGRIAVVSAGLPPGTALRVIYGWWQRVWWRWCGGFMVWLAVTLAVYVVAFGAGAAIVGWAYHTGSQLALAGSGILGAMIAVTALTWQAGFTQALWLQTYRREVHNFAPDTSARLLAGRPVTNQSHPRYWILLILLVILVGVASYWLLSPNVINSYTQLIH